MKFPGFYQTVLVINALLPLGLLGLDSIQGSLGPNPIEFFLRATGVIALVFLVLTLAVSPLRKLFGWNSLIKHRRTLGLFAFLYGTLHFITYSYFDRGLDLGSIASDVWQRPFIAVGMTAFTLLIPLAVTSTNGWVKRLGGKAWVKLHRLTYVIAVLAVIHFWMIVKSDVFYPAIFGTIIVILLSWRYWESLKKRLHSRPKSKDYRLRSE